MNLCSEKHREENSELAMTEKASPPQSGKTMFCAFVKCSKPGALPGLQGWRLSPLASASQPLGPVCLCGDWVSVPREHQFAHPGLQPPGAGAQAPTAQFSAAAPCKGLLACGPTTSLPLGLTPVDMCVQGSA